MQKFFLQNIFVSALFILFANLIFAQSSKSKSTNYLFDIPEGTNIDLTTFLTKVSQNTRFEIFLTEQLRLKHQEIVSRGANETALDFIGGYVLPILATNTNTSQTTRANNTNSATNNSFLRQVDLGVSLRQLFYPTATTMTVGWTNRPGATFLQPSRSTFGVQIIQPIVKNAFGNLNRRRDAIAGIERQVATYQTVEAYEDYLAAILTVFYRWYLAKEIYQLRKSSIIISTQLLNEIRARQRARVANVADVNSVKLQIIQKQEALIRARQDYLKESLKINVALFNDKQNNQTSLPSFVPLYQAFKDIEQIDFDVEKTTFLKSSRTIKILKKLEKKSKTSVEVARADLLPSAKLRLSWNVSGQDYDFKEPSQNVQFNFSIGLPSSYPQEIYSYQKAQLDLTYLNLSQQNKRLSLEESISALKFEIEMQKQFAKFAEEKLRLLNSTYQVEQDDYQKGLISLKEFIRTIEQRDTQRSAAVNARIRLDILFIEWLRLTDNLVIATSTKQFQAKKIKINFQK